MTSDRFGCALPALIALLLALGLLGLADPPIDFKWEVHDMQRPLPPEVTPGAHGGPPSDAQILVGADGIGAWRSGDGEAKWTFADGVMTVAPGTGAIHSRGEYGDCQLHLEWRLPRDRAVRGQGGGNSGVFFMDRYEVQILHTLGNRTYADGMAGAVYGQYPPLVNPCRPAGEWNVYDLIFRAPRFDADGAVLEPARITALFNGVLVQDDVRVLGPTSHQRRARYEPHGETGPLRLQDHGDPIAFRNVWVRPLAPRRGPE